MFEKRVTEADKKAALKENKKNRTEKAGGKNDVAALIKAVLIPLVLATIVVCIIYLVLSNKAKNEIEKAPVVCAKMDIVANTFIGQDEMDKYFEVKKVDAAAIPSNIYSDITDMPKNGFYIEENVNEKQMVSKSLLSETDTVMDKYGEGTLVTSIKVNAFDNSVSGKLRRGDIVDVYALDPATDELVLMVSEVYVEGAFDASGNELTPAYEAENGAGAAVVFSVRVAPDEIEAMNMAISYKGIQLYLTGK